MKTFLEKLNMAFSKLSQIYYSTLERLEELATPFLGIMGYFVEFFQNKFVKTILNLIAVGTVYFQFTNWDEKTTTILFWTLFLVLVYNFKKLFNLTGGRPILVFFTSIMIFQVFNGYFLTGTAEAVKVFITHSPFVLLAVHISLWLNSGKSNWHTVRAENKIREANWLLAKANGETKLTKSSFVKKEKMKDLINK